MSRFERFVGIDWSGAKGAAQSGIQIAELEVNSTSPRLKCAPKARNWSRPDVMEYIGQLNDRPTLIGIDFAFSVPWDDGTPLSLRVSDARALWALIDLLCDGTPHLYAGPVWTDTNSPFRPYIFHHQTGYRGECYDRKNRREVERLEGNAISVYHMAGPQVGASSFSGMRMLHHLKMIHGEAVAIWPFDKVDFTKTPIFEIYPSYFYRMAAAKRPSRSDLRGSNYAEIDKALSYYGATRAADNLVRSVDQADALIAAAALGRLANNFDFEIPAGHGLDVREGWIFGFPFGDDFPSAN